LRRLKRDWITEYTDFIAPASESPPNYLFWSAATGIAACLKRSVWVDRKSWKLFPNMYTVLVGRPGIGKGSAINPVTNLIKEAGCANLISDRTTIERLLEKLDKGFPAITPNGNGTVHFGKDSSCLVSASELQVFATASQFTLPILADLWDAKDIFEYGTKTQGKFVIDKPTVSLLGGSTTEWLVQSIPHSAVGGGFTRRVNFVYAKSRDKHLPWPTIGVGSIIQDLVEDLRVLSQVKGEMKFDKGAESVFEDIYNTSDAGDFDDEATAAYKSSMWAHATKLAMVLSAASGDNMVISKDHITTAVSAVREVVKDIGLVFRAVGESTMVSAVDKVLQFIELKGYSTRADIQRALWRHVSSSDLDIILNTLTTGNLITFKNQGNKVIYEIVAKMVP
jgi:energy-coupling factor transporter ATP-binding protein EcfA2